jgi:hypothetical protein
MLYTPTSSGRGRRGAWISVTAFVAALALFGAMATTSSAAGVPVVTSLSPAAGPIAGGNAVIIVGSNLTGASDVKVDGASVGSPGAGFTVTDSTHITIASMPAHAAGTVDIQVVSSDALPNVNTAGDNYTYHNVPAVTAVNPVSGPASGGTLVTITGSGFTGATSVTFGGTAVAGLSVVDDAHVVVNAPAHAAGLVNVQVTTPGGTSPIVAADQYTYTAVTAVTGLTPASGVAGTVVTISGSGFTGATSVTFGGTASAFNVVSDNIITAVSPAHALGTVDVIVTSPTGTSATVAEAKFTYTTATTVTSIAPVSGVAGTTVTIYGSGFTGATSVTFGGSFASFTVVNDNIITAVSPAHALGVVNVIVTAPGGTSAAVAGSQFTYTSGVPSITALTPSIGTSGALTITGTGFTGTTSVTFGGLFASFTLLSNTTITAIAPVHSVGTVQVTVTNPAGSSPFTTAANFTYRLNFCPLIPLWVNDLDYGSIGGGFYWDPVSGLVWTAQRGWHLFAPVPPRFQPQPMWTNAITYGSAGEGFYWDPVSGQVWTAERGWHLYSPQNCQ